MSILSALFLLLGDAQFDAITNASTAAAHDQACAQMQVWVDAHPEDPLAPRGLLWMAQLRRADDRADLARPLFAAILRQYPRSDWALHARKGLADLDVQEHRYQRAIETYRALAREPSPFWQYLGRNSAEAAQGARDRFYLFVVLFGATALLWISRVWRRGVRLFWPLPGELVYPLPILLLVLLAATGQEPDEARAICAVAIGAMALLWLNGSWLRAEKRRRLLNAGFAVAQLCALLYCSVVATGLWGKLIDTFAGGGD